MKPVIHIRQRFTMVETVVAFAILMLALTAIFASIAASQQRVIRAERAWRRTHLLLQASEYLLLAPPNSPIPHQLFPEENYRVEVTYRSPNDLPNGVTDSNNGWRLVDMTVSLYDRENHRLTSIVLERIVKSEDL